MKPTRRSLEGSLLLYVFVLLGLGLAYMRPGLGWLAPISMGALLAGNVWFWYREGRPFLGLGLHITGVWYVNLLIGLVVGVALPVAFILALAANGLASLRLVHDSSLMIAIFWLGVVRIVLTVVFEEIVFRGYYLQSFASQRGIKLAIVLSSLLWSFLHLPNMLGSHLQITSIAAGLISFTVLGIALAISFLRTGGLLWFPFGLHYGYNFAFSSLGALFKTIYHAPAWLVGQPPWVPESGIQGILLSSAILITVYITTNRKQG
jgi:membrane protease YdiL (CAAX protease family)